MSFRGEPCFAVVEYIMRCSRSMSLTLRLHSSTGLSPVSLLIESLMDNIRPADAVSISICSLVGILMVLGSCLYWGGCQSIL